VIPPTEHSAGLDGDQLHPAMTCLVLRLAIRTESKIGNERLQVLE
jgi:hypothetical protein